VLIIGGGGRPKEERGSEGETDKVEAGLHVCMLAYS